MEKVIIVGAGGHSRSVMDILIENNEYEILGCLDPIFNIKKRVEGMEYIPIIGTDSDMEKFKKDGITKVFIAIGDNVLRKKLFDNAIKLGMESINAISKYSRISKTASMGTGNCIMAGAIINVNSRIGDGCIINTNCSLDHDCDIGSFVHIAPGVAVSGATSIGAGTHIGTNAGIIDGIKIGSWSYIGAGSTVVKDLPSNVLAYGVPARIKKEI